MHIKALLRASLIEYPGHIADVAYVGLCNFRCPYCHNVDLVLHPHTLPDIEPAEILDELKARRGFIDGLVVTGGEPTLQPDLIEFLTDVRQLGLAVKLDTNGYRPDVLQECLERQIPDYVAMDIKSSFGKYELVAGVPVRTELLRRSMALILRSPIEYEFRTTIVPGLVDTHDVRAIARAIHGAKRYYLQCFRPGRTLSWEKGDSLAPPSPELMRHMAGLAAHHVREVGIRGLPQQAQRVASVTPQPSIPDGHRTSQ